MSSAGATGGDGGTGDIFHSDYAKGGDASASSTGTSTGSGGVESFATATGGVGGNQTFFIGAPAGPGGNALSTADSTALIGGAATATATATAGAPGTGSQSPPAWGAANATSRAETAKGAMAQAQSIAVGPSGQAQSTATTSFEGVSVKSAATVPIGNGAAAKTNAIVQGGAGQAFDKSGQTDDAFSTALPDEAYATTLIDGASNVAEALLRLGLPQSVFSAATDINGSGQAVGRSFVGATQYAVEWSGGGVINLGGLPGASSSVADGINNSGQVVGSSVVGGTEYAVEWSGGSLIKLEDLPGSAGSVAAAINDAGVVVGESGGYATEWSGGRVINLGGLPGSSFSEAESINKSGQVVGFSVVGGVTYATEWSGGSVINLGGLPGATFSSAESINSFGQVVGESDGSTAVPEPSTWAMMLLGFAGLASAGYRRARAGRAPLACQGLRFKSVEPRSSCMDGHRFARGFGGFGDWAVAGALPEPAWSAKVRPCQKSRPGADLPRVGRSLGKFSVKARELGFSSAFRRLVYSKNRAGPVRRFEVHIHCHNDRRKRNAGYTMFGGRYIASGCFRTIERLGWGSRGFEACRQLQGYPRGGCGSHRHY